MVQVKTYFQLCSWVILLALGGCQPKSSTSSPETTSADSLGAPAATEQAQATIVFFGNSLTAGYGVEKGEGYPELIEKRLDSLKLGYQVVNAGLSGETTAGGTSRIEWILKQPVSIFVLELGGNDGLRGIDPKISEQNLQKIIDKVKEKNPKVKILLAGMQPPPNMGKEYTENFKQMYPRLAEKNKISLIPFLLEGVGGNPKLNLPDGIHPTPSGHKIVAETVWRHLEPLLKAN